MTRPPRTRLGVSAFLFGACALALGTAPASAQSFRDAACQAFEGSEDCRTVTVVDPDACIVKVRPNPIADLDPAIAGCLIDDIGTKQVFLKNARPEDTVVRGDAGAAGGTGSKTSVRISGREIVQVLTGYDENGAPVWQPRDSDTFEHGGDPARTRTVLEMLSSDFCSRQAKAAGPAPPAGDPVAGAEATARVIGVDEAFRLSAEGRIVLIDVRQESEWRETGIAATAIPVTMHQRMDDFVKRIGAEAGADGRTPIALICAHGERSAWLQRELGKYGFDRIIDVHGGMLGGKRAPGWIGSGLPVKPYDPKP
ncbi:MAG: rhodanese-like domain-containing protein [Alphaproteobacteria bacterium]|nr:rhodanese-like domain-containing protein [Alphaproteobacteria bacterium]